jgi:hypothetical protein
MIDDPIVVTFFENFAAMTNRKAALTLAQLAGRIAITSASTKDRLPWLKLATFGDVRSEKGSLRHDANLISISGVEVDYDGEKITFDDAVERVEKEGLEALVYTSPSHRRDGHGERWRIVCALAKEYPPEHRERFVNRLAGLFRDGNATLLAAESWTRSQAYYFGAVDHNPAHRVKLTEGQRLDTLDELDLIALGKPATKSPGPGKPNGAGVASGPADEAALLDQIVSGASYHTGAMRLLGVWGRRGVPLLEAERRLREAFDAAPIHDQRWRNRVAEIPRLLGDIWGREARKEDAQEENLAEFEARQPPPEAEAPEDPSELCQSDEQIVDDDAEIARLARLRPLAFEREVKAAAKQLGCPVALLRKLVAAVRGEGNKGNGQGQPLELPEFEPWPNPVDGDWLLEAVIAAIQRYVVIDHDAVRATALWVVATHCFAAFPVFPRLFITAAEMQCGKTTLLDVLSLVTPRPLAVANISPAALFRIISAFRPTLLLDEFDGYTKDTAEELRQLINAGHKRGGRVVGDTHEPRLFDAYSPMAIAAIGAIAGTLIDRSIVIPLRRRLAREAVASLRLDRAPELHTLARQIARWAADHGAALAQVDPAMAGRVNRSADNWRPLFAVAELAGNGWSDLAHDAAASMVGREPDETSVRVRLLFDIRACFAAQKADRLSSEAIVEYLVGLEDRPWPEWGKTRKPISKVQLARLLRPLRISPGTIREEDGPTPKGYKKTAFKDAFDRYLPPEGDLL